MKLSIKFVVAAIALLSSSKASAFLVSSRQSARLISKLDATTLDEWQLLDNGSVVGSVRGHPSLNDGDIITTSPLADPANAVSGGSVTTLTGSQYELGSPMYLKRNRAAQAVPEEPGLDRSTAIQTIGIGTLVAGGFALGIGVGGRTGTPQMTVAEAKVGIAFPGALTNDELVKKVSNKLINYGYGKSTLVATSLCCDEVNRPLEKALASTYDEPFVMGGLAGFPFGGVTSFGAMAHHIPDGGSCLVVYGPHVGVDSNGSVGTVNRRGRAKGGSCCGSAAAALGKIRKGQMVPKAESPTSLPATNSLDAQQAYVDAQLAPYAERLLNAEERNVELPFALYDAQKIMMDSIVETAAGGGAMEGNGYIALLGGIQINTPDGISDYFLPISFELRNNQGKLQKSLMWA